MRMQPGDKFIVRHSLFRVKRGEVIIFDQDDGTQVLPYRFVKKRGSFGFWFNRKGVDRNLIAYNDLTNKERFLFELAGLIPERSI